MPILTRFAYCSPQLDPLPREWADGDGMTSRAWCARRRGNCVSMLVSQLYRLTDLLTRPTETGETARDADDSRQADHQVSKTYRDAGDEEDARRTAHNPEVAGFKSRPRYQARRLSRGDLAGRFRCQCDQLCNQRVPKSASSIPSAPAMSPESGK